MKYFILLLGCLALVACSGSYEDYTPSQKETYAFTATISEILGEKESSKYSDSMLSEVIAGYPTQKLAEKISEARKQNKIPCIWAGYDPYINFPLTVKINSVGEKKSPFTLGDTVQFIVHSYALMGFDRGKAREYQNKTFKFVFKVDFYEKQYSYDLDIQQE